jgi:hypothetical protein
MKKLYFSALALFVLCTGYVNAQSSGEQTTAPAVPEQTSSASFLTVYAEQNSNRVVIRWQMPAELNIDHFELERATDGTHFAPLHEVVARGGPDEVSYKDEDNSALGQFSSYRLKIVDKNGNAFYSQTASVDMTGRNAPAIKPTVLHMGSTLRLNMYSPQTLTVNFFNEGGNLAGSYIVNGTSFDINTSAWGKGLYFYRISDQAHPFISSGKVMIL